MSVFDLPFGPHDPAARIMAERDLTTVRAELDQAYAMKAEVDQHISDLTVEMIRLSRDVSRSGSVIERLPVANEGHPGPGHTAHQIEESRPNG